MSVAATRPPRVEGIWGWGVEYVEGVQIHCFRLLTCRALHLAGDRGG